MIKKKNVLIVKKGKGKGCIFCKENRMPIWQDYEKLGEFLSPRGRILSCQITGVCAKHQRKLANVIKQARHLALLSFTTQE